MNFSVLTSLIMSFALVVLMSIEASGDAGNPSPALGCDGKLLCIGVRSDARPFSYIPDASRVSKSVATDGPRGPLTRAGYTGYMIQICDAVLAEMVLESNSDTKLTFDDIGIFDIDRNRNDQSGTRFNDLGIHFDILCDPATITNDRRVGLTVSPPLFLTGISYVTLKDSPLPKSACQNPSKPLIGLVGGTTAESRGIRALVDAGELPRYETELVNYLRGIATCPSESKPRVKSYGNHSDAAKAFCESSFDYYIGDLEIITENIKTIPGCSYTNGTQTYTNDRYAIFGKAIAQQQKDEYLKRELSIAQFFEILSQKTIFTPSILDKAFSDTFQNVRPSKKLEVFFWSIRGERN
ncbi:extracellular solute-binding protein (family 3) [Hoeflea marina]|uniref:Extracellular solute-binding protein (Family 3) n=1 Tax=Hoeflea marina TaxID=274592 RepID=A0A317PMJ9_9HYPH|nr:transporter substrate-binding domain-containing protein [Hoeflea marina]PWW01987.1 extracellular solute-binding protein (family 3) [Hoeflea marina]